MKVTKRLSEYVAIKVESKIPITDTSYTVERDIRSLINSISEEFIDKISVLRDELLKEAEEKHPQLKQLTRRSFDDLRLYTVCGSDFENYYRDIERKERCKRKTIQERIVLRIELADEGLSLDDIDLIIEAEIAKSTMHSTES